MSSAAAPTHFTLNTGAKIPAVGLGAYKVRIERAILLGAKIGFR
jgi:diketogulonate reductase-like aldo/keto reductase